MSIYRLLLVVVFVCALSIGALADTIRLKDGSTIKGKILSFSNGQFVILIGNGDRQRQIRFFADEIEAIEFDSKSGAANITPTVTSSNTGTKSPGYSKTTTGDSTIITVGSSTKTPNPPMNSPRVVKTNTPDKPTTTDSTPPPATRTVSTSAAKPIEVSVKVLADNTANGWTNAGWVVRKGQRIRIRGAGRISLGNGRFAGPQGISTLPDSGKLIQDKPTGSLIAVIGDDNNDFIYIGKGVEFVAQRDGALFLGVNEGNLNDNSGAFNVVIEIDPKIGN